MFGAERRLDQALAAWNGGNYGVALDLGAPLAPRAHARAEQGDADAQDHVGARLGAENEAAQGRTAAMARLGDMHHNALGVGRDRRQALHWLEQAEAGGAGELAAGFLKLARAAP